MLNKISKDISKINISIIIIFVILFILYIVELFGLGYIIDFKEKIQNGRIRVIEIKEVGLKNKEEKWLRYASKYGWIRLIINKKELPIEFIEKYAHQVDWDRLSIIDNLAEEIIWKCKDYINWHRISEFQNLSPEFVYEHFDRIVWPNLGDNYFISSYFRKFVNKDIVQGDYNVVIKKLKLCKFIEEKKKEINKLKKEIGECKK